MPKANRIHPKNCQHCAQLTQAIEQTGAEWSKAKRERIKRLRESGTATVAELERAARRP
jgi:hypothetical protein